MTRKYDLDADRLAKNLRAKFGDRITDRNSFSFFYDKYTEDIKIKDELKPRVFTEYVKDSVKKKLPLKEVKKLKTKEVVETFKPTDGRTKIVKKEFKTVGRIKGKVVFTRKEFVVVKKTRVVRFRDRKGRFASIRRLKKKT